MNEKVDAPLVFQLIPQFHDPHLDPPLFLMVQYPSIRLSMHRRSLEVIDKIAISPRPLRTVGSAGRTLADLKKGGVAGNVSVCPAANSCQYGLTRRE